jgi:hypothetical protein
MDYRSGLDLDGVFQKVDSFEDGNDAPELV